MTGILFDFNGVLFQDSEFHEQAWAEFTTRNTNTELSNTAINSFFHGRQNRSALEFLFKRTLSEQDIMRYSEEKESIYRDICLSNPDQLILSDGAIDFIETLKSRDLHFTIVTSSCLSNVEFYFNVLKLDQWFSKEIIVYDDGTITGKPAPDSFIEGARRIAKPISQCIVFEDSTSGIVAARLAGAQKIVGYATAHNHATLVENGAHIVVESFKDEAVLNLLPTIMAI